MRFAQIVLAASLVASGCQLGPTAKQALQPAEDAAALRQLQTRRFDGITGTELQAATASVLQDLGFVVEASEPELGLLVGSQRRSAFRWEQVVGYVILAALTGVYLPHDTEQTIRVSVVVRPVHARPGSSTVRATFQRVVRTEQNLESRRETLKDPELYQDFFQQLSKAVFLEAHRL